MATASVTYSFTAATTAVSAQVNQDFTDVVTFLNNQVVHVDGSKLMTGQLSLPAVDPTTANQAARKSYVDTKALYKGAAASTTALVGSVPTTDTQLLIKAGMSSISSDANSVCTITFSSPFPNSLLSITASPVIAALLTGGANVAANFGSIIVTTASLSNANLRISSTAGAGSPAAGPFIFTWIAVGN